MANCAQLAGCPFTKAIEDDEKLKLAMNGFIKMYCQGAKQGECKRKLVGKSLGGQSKVPMNLMPGGLPLPNTANDDWPVEVKVLLNIK